jgi:hypothetical protein
MSDTDTELGGDSASTALTACSRIDRNLFFKKAFPLRYPAKNRLSRAFVDGDYIPTLTAVPNTKPHLLYRRRVSAAQGIERRTGGLARSRWLRILARISRQIDAF